MTTISDLFFLDYLSRSGSTLLAKKLAELEGLQVTIEPRFLKDYNPSNLKIENLDDLDNYLDFLFSHKKFMNWRLKRETLFERLKRIDMPIRFNEVLNEILASAYPNLNGEAILVKGGGYYCINIKDYLKYFPEMKVLFIVRDPRAIFNSQRKSIDSITGKVMQDNMLRFVRAFKLVTQNIHNPKYKPHIKVLRYEDFIDNEQAVLNKAIDFVGLHGSNNTSDIDYFDKIPEEQKHLHINVSGKGMLVERKDAWKDELSRAEIATLEYLLKKELKVWNYQPLFGAKLSPTVVITISHFIIKRLTKYVKGRFTTRK